MRSGQRATSGRTPLTSGRRIANASSASAFLKRFAAAALGGRAESARSSARRKRWLPRAHVAALPIAASAGRNSAPPTLAT